MHFASSLIWCARPGFLSVEPRFRRRFIPAPAYYPPVMSRALSLDTVLTQQAGLLANTVDGETILLRLSPPVYFGLAGPAHHIWQLLAEPSTGHAICSRLEALYDVDPETCRAEVARFLALLAGENLLTVVSGAAA